MLPTGYDVFYLPKITFLTLSNVVGLTFLASFNRDIWIYKKVIYISLIAILFFVFQNFFVEIRNIRTFYFSIFVLAQLIASFVVLGNLKETCGNAFVKIRHFLLVGANMESFIVFFQMIFLLFFSDERYSKMKLYGTIGNPEYISIVLGFIIILDYEIQKKWKWGYTAPLLGILILQSRSVYVASLIMVITFFWRNIYSFISKRPWKSFSLLLLIFSITSFLFYYFFSLKSIYGRALIWLTSLKILSLKPLWGVGYNQYENYFYENLAYVLKNTDIPRLLTSSTGLVKHAHNSLLEFVIEFGVVFSVPLLILLYRSRVIFLQSRVWGYLFIVSLVTFPFHQISTMLLVPLLLVLSMPIKSETTAIVVNRWMLILFVPVSIYYLIPYVKQDYYHLQAIQNENERQIDKSFSYYERAINFGFEYRLYLHYAQFLAMNDRLYDSYCVLEQISDVRISIDDQKLLGVVLYKNKKYEESLKIYKKLSLIFPKHVSPNYMLAMNYLGMRDEILFAKYKKIVSKLHPFSIKGIFEKKMLMTTPFIK